MTAAESIDPSMAAWGEPRSKTVHWYDPMITAADSGVLRATGRVIKPGRRVAFCAAEIVDHAGKIVATASSSCLVMDPRVT